LNEIGKKMIRRRICLNFEKSSYVRIFNWNWRISFVSIMQVFYWAKHFFFLQLSIEVFEEKKTAFFMFFLLIISFQTVNQLLRLLNTKKNSRTSFFFLANKIFSTNINLRLKTKTTIFDMICSYIKWIDRCTIYIFKQD